MKNKCALFLSFFAIPGRNFYKVYLFPRRGQCQFPEIAVGLFFNN